MKRLLILLCGAALVAQVVPVSAQTLRINEVLANGVTALGGLYDGVEIYNGGPGAVDLAGHSLSDSLNNRRKYVFPADSVVPAGGFFAVTLDPASTNNSFGLKAGGDRVFLYDPLSIQVDFLVFGLQTADLSVGRVPDGSENWVLTAPTFGAANAAVALAAADDLKINEWMAAPSGNDEDYFELFNGATNPVALAGLVLGDAGLVETTIPALSFIGAEGNGFAAFTADDNVAAGADHVGFKLAASGDSLRVKYGNGVIIDLVTFGAQATGVSEGRLPDGGTEIRSFPGHPTPGEPNFGRITNLVVSELLTHTDPPLEDAVELFNVTDQPVNIGGWYLSDKFSDLTRYRIPNGTVVPAHGYKVIYEFQFNAANGVNPTEPFTYNAAHGGSLFLTQPDQGGVLVNYLERTFPAAENGVSFGRLMSSDGHFDFTALACRSFGHDNLVSLADFRLGQGLTNACGPKLGPVIINEIMFQPPDFVTDVATNDNSIDEYIELRNLTAAPVPLYDPNALTNHWKLANGVTYEFAAGDVMPALGLVLVVNFDPVTNLTQLAAFRAKYAVADGVRIFGPYGGKLDNNGESVELFKPDPPQGAGRPDEGFVPFILVDKVKYNDQAPWPTNAAGTGLALQRVVTSAYGNDPTNWTANLPTAGRANVPSILIATQPQSQSALVGSNAVFSVEAAGAAPHYQWFFKNKPLLHATNATLSITNASVKKSAGVYSVQVSNALGSVRSSNATLQVLTPVKVTVQPPSRTVLESRKTVFVVHAKGSPPLTYQWWLNGNPLLNATNLRLVVTNAQPFHAGLYTATVSNALSGAVSSTATLTVKPRAP